MIKLGISSKVYAVLPGNKIAEITTQEIAEALYGEETWAASVVVVPDFFFANFEKVAPITEIIPHDGMMFRIKGGNFKRVLYIF